MFEWLRRLVSGHATTLPPQSNQPKEGQALADPTESADRSTTSDSSAADDDWAEKIRLMENAKAWAEDPMVRDMLDRNGDYG
jgi:hypothetical protein